MDASSDEIPRLGLDIWNYKAYIETPALAKGGGLVLEYRHWDRPFYPEPRAEA